MKTITKKVRNAAIVLAVFMLASSCGGGKVTDVWDERELVLTAIQPGIPCYLGSNITYRRDGKPLLSVELQEPVVLSVASKPERWGPYQFPNLFRNAKGLVEATWYLGADHPKDYGKKLEGTMVSSDNGKTWRSPDQPAPMNEPTAYGRNTLFLPRAGYSIGIHTQLSLKASELQLPPQPVASLFENYGSTFFFYRISELPAVLQGVFLNRLDGNGEWSVIHAGLEDPKAVRYSRAVGRPEKLVEEPLISIVWEGNMKLLSDNSIVTGIYPSFYENETGGVDPSCVSFYRSTDDGMNWKILGKIPYSYDPAVDPNGNKRLVMGFTEPSFEILSDGTFLCMMRTTDGLGHSPMYHSRSSDQGATWSQPKPITPAGVLPRLLQLENGVLVLSSGRPGVQLRFSIDGKGEKWTDPFEMLPFTETALDIERNSHDVSCGYTELLAIGSDRFLVIYSDFKFLNENGEKRKAIKVREIKVTKKSK